jgi:GR25 family glycosyltransferase involved in LPS biosynthesis
VRFPVDAIFFISLPKAALRRKKLIEYCQKINLTDKFGNEHQWVVASDGNRPLHKVDNSLKKTVRKQNLSLGEIGCFESHRLLWRRILDAGYERVMILEDDARFDIDKTNQLVTNWNRLPDFDFLHLGWNYYAGYGEQSIEQVECIEGLDLWKGNHMWLTHAYIVTQEGAGVLYEHTHIQNNGLDAMTAWIQDHMESYGFKPHVAYQEHFASGVLRSQIHHTG